MAATDELLTDVKSILNDYGTKVVLRYFSMSGATTGYDDDKTLTVSGTDIWTSGLPQPLSSKYGSKDHVLVQQGRIRFDDTKLYLAGDTFTNGSQPMRVGIGSPTPEWYSVLDMGVDAFDMQGSTVYKKAYLRFLGAGSLAGE